MKSSEKVLEILRDLINDPKSELEFSSNYELLVAVMLSAQCTDKRVNIITRKLFKVANTPEKMIHLSIEQIEEYIKSCNYYHNKAKNIYNASLDIVKNFDGQVPDNYNDLVSLSGVGNKTANVILAVGFGVNALPVDTHVLRVSNRLGFVNTNNPTKCENELKKIFKNKDWAEIHHLMLLFGRYYCKATKPDCENCKLKKFCKKIK
jgi:endonuclease-3